MAPRVSRSKARKKSRPFSIFGQLEREGRIVAQAAQSAPAQSTRAVRAPRAGGRRTDRPRQTPASAACHAMPVSRGPIVAFDRLERLQAENVFGVDRVRIAPQNLDSGDAQRLLGEVRPAGAAPAFAAAGTRPAGRARAQRQDSARRALPAPSSPRAPAAAAMRCRKREATVGSPPRFFARLRIASGAPSAATKSCAVWPMRRSGAERPSAARIGRLRKASVSTAGGQTVSSRPARSTRSKLRRRASEQAEDHEARVAAARRRSARRGQRIVEQARRIR